MNNINETLQKKRAELKEVFDNPAEDGKYSAEQKNAINGLNTELAELVDSANTAKASAEKGVWLAGLITTGQPTPKAGAHFLVIIVLGKFQGVIAPTTPTGCLITTILLSGSGSGIISPYTLFTSSA